jgi:SH3-like domain-containing protein
VSSRFAKSLLAGAALIGLGLAGVSPAIAQTTGSAALSISRGPSGLPLPRFVSLKSGRVNLRIGPGLNYAVEWMYLKAGLPMEIIQEYDNWRRVRDADGTEGWINQSLLSGKRTAIVTPWQRGKQARIPMLARPGQDSRVVAQLEPGVIGEIRTCNGEWCEMEISGHRGWVEQSQIWGAYPGETIAN